MENETAHKLLKVSQQAVILNEEGEVLVLKQTKGGHWLLPGGRIEVRDGKNWQEALKREVREETGLEIEIGRIVANEISPLCDTYAVAFLCEKVSGDVSLSDEHAEYAWVALAELPDYLHYVGISHELRKSLS